MYYNTITLIKLQLADLQCSFFIKDKLHKCTSYILATFYFSTMHLIMLYFYTGRGYSINHFLVIFLEKERRRNANFEAGSLNWN